MRSAKKRYGIALAAMLLLAMVMLYALPFDAERYCHVQASGEIRARDGTLLFAYLTPDDQWCFERDLSEISPHLINATIATEDQRFYHHFGVDPLAIVRAFRQNLSARRIVSGASTITMQVIKRAQKEKRSLWGKISQMLAAIRLEMKTDKDTILRTYLNTAPYGLNLVGCEAASRRYFGKSARELTLAEAALLAGLPKAPTTYMPLRNPDAALRRRNYVLTRMRQEGFVSEEDYLCAFATPLGVKRHHFPALARHFAMQVQPVVSQGKVLRSTLDANIQRTVERLLHETIRSYDGKIGNAATIVVDVPTASILGRAGSADFFDTPGGGQVDVCRSRRSPGSALKPFLYAAAIERNCLYSSEMLLDSVLDYGMYSPENADGTYRGLVSATEALRRSLNVPAVVVLERVGVEGMYYYLQQMGFRSFRKGADYYGLGFALGDCEVTLEELTTAYTMLAALGQYRPLTTLHDSKSTQEGRQIISRGTCLQLYQMLEQPLPEEMGKDAITTAGYLPRVCWKTGTSTGQRDAWAFVFNRRYVVGVWMGNNSGKPSPWLVGARAALPLAGKLFRSLPLDAAPTWPDFNNEMLPVSVCAVSGLPATPWCDRKRETLLPRDQFLNRVCDVHYPTKDPTGGFKTVERWPGTAKGWDLAHVQFAELHTNNNSPAARVSATKILEPSNRAEFVLTREPQGDRIRLKTSTDAETPIYWYLNDQYLGISTPSTPLYLQLEPGQHRLTCMNPRGETDTTEFTVSLPQDQPDFRTR